MGSLRTRMQQNDDFVLKGGLAAPWEADGVDASHDRLRDWLAKTPAELGARQCIHIDGVNLYNGIFCVTIGVLNLFTGGRFLFGSADVGADVASEMFSLCITAFGATSMMMHFYLRAPEEGRFVMAKAGLGYHGLSVLCIIRRLYLGYAVAGPSPQSFYCGAGGMILHGALGFWYFVWLALMREKRRQIQSGTYESTSGSGI